MTADASCVVGTAVTDVHISDEGVFGRPPTCTSSEPLVLVPLNEDRLSASACPSVNRLTLLLLETDSEFPLHDTSPLPCSLFPVKLRNAHFCRAFDVAELRAASATLVVHPTCYHCVHGLARAAGRARAAPL